MDFRFSSSSGPRPFSAKKGAQPSAADFAMLSTSLATRASSSLLAANISLTRFWIRPPTLLICVLRLNVSASYNDLAADLLLLLLQLALLFLVRLVRA